MEGPRKAGELEVVPADSSQATPEGRTGADASPRRSRAWLYGRNTLIMLAVALTVWWSLYRLRGEPDDRNEHLNYLLAHKNDFNILFVGSSITRGNIDSIRFQERLREAGYDARVFSIGMGAADMHQIDWALKAFLRRRPANLRYVFVELRPYELEVTGGYEFTPPKIRWHDPWQTLSALRTVEVSDETPYHKEQARRRHITHFVLKYLPVGRLLKPREEEDLGGFVPELHGYIPYDEQSERRLSQFRAFLAEGELYERLVLRKRLHLYEPSPLEHYNLEAFRGQVNAIRKAGAIPVYWTGPSIHDYDFANALRQAGELPHYFFFDDAEKYPFLFDISMRLDKTHLNNQGTRIFTDIFANLFLESGKGPLQLPELAAEAN